MNSELSNLCLFASLLWKAGTMTGLLPAILFVYVAETLVSAFGGPAPHQGGRWLVWVKSLSAFKGVLVAKTAASFSQQ